MKKQAFTLAETLIVLIVIGILAAILLPVARNIAPDKNLMKFKKAHNLLGTTFRELVQSEEYYRNGLLAYKKNGDFVDSSKYLCETFSDILMIKEKNCVDEVGGKGKYGHDVTFDINVWPEAGLDYKQFSDYACKRASIKFGNEIVTSDGIHFFEAGPGYHFGSSEGRYFDNASGGTCIPDTPDKVFEDCERKYLLLKKDDTFYIIYKIFCIDIDGTPANATVDDCVNECPFGYGIRVDGQIIAGERAEQWLEREK